MQIAKLHSKSHGVIDLVAGIKSKQIKKNSQEWLDGEVAEKISVSDNFKTSY